jgi:hypothetical protein
MYYILDAESIEVLLSKYPHCGGKVNSFLAEAETLICLESYKDAKSNGPIFASRLAISCSSVRVGLTTVLCRIEMQKLRWREISKTMASTLRLTS